MTEPDNIVRDRNSRNLLAWGKEAQDLLYKSRVLVVGSDVLAQYILTGLAGLSVGNVFFMDNSEINPRDADFLCPHRQENIWQEKVTVIQDTLQKINVKSRNVGMYSRFCDSFVKKKSPEMIIDATNDSVSKEKALIYAMKHGIPLLSASSDAVRSALTAFFPKSDARSAQANSLDAVLLREFNGKRQGAFSSGVIAGITTEEFRKVKFSYPNYKNDNPLPNLGMLAYNLFSQSRRNLNENGFNPPVYFKDKKVCVVGGGGIGTYVVLNLALLGVGRIDVIDNDEIKIHNLNRQCLFYERVGKRKADVLGERVKEIDHNIDFRAIKAMVGAVDPKEDGWLKELYEIEKENYDPSEHDGFKCPSFGDFIRLFYGIKGGPHPGFVSGEDLRKGGYDLVFGCLDNKMARLWLNNFAVRYGIPYIDGGSGPKKGVVAAYVPGKTKCLNCQLDFMNYPSPQYGNSCALRPEASVVMSNMIVGSAMVGEAIKIMYGLGDPLQNPLIYDVSLKPRLSFIPQDLLNTNPNCSC